MDARTELQGIDVGESRRKRRRDPGEAGDPPPYFFFALFFPFFLPFFLETFRIFFMAIRVSHPLLDNSGYGTKGFRVDACSRRRGGARIARSG